jgi:hypothetical protein
MEEMIETRVPPQRIWEMWEKAHSLQGQPGLEEGRKGKHTFKYKIFNIKKGESFSVLWKTLFVRLLFCYTVRPSLKGSLISCRVEIKGLFSWLVRWLLSAKIRHNLKFVLKEMVKQVEISLK